MNWEDQITRLFTQQQLPLPVAWELLSPGIHTNIRVETVGGRQFLLRLGTGRKETSGTFLRKEALIYNYLQNLELPVPQVIAVGTSEFLPAPYLILGYLPGENGQAAELLFDSTANSYQAMYREMGSLLSRFHRVSTANLRDSEGLLRNFTDDWRNTLVANTMQTLAKSHAIWPSSLLHRTLSLLEKYAKWLPQVAKPCLLHRDYKLHNVLFHRVAGSVTTLKISGVIDWEWAMLGDPVFDLASTDICHTRWGRFFLEGYFSDQSPPENLEKSLHLYRIVDNVEIIARAGEEVALDLQSFILWQLQVMEKLAQEAATW